MVENWPLERQDMANRSRRQFISGDPREFINRYVKWNDEVIEKEPLDILAHPTWLTSPLDKD